MKQRAKSSINISSMEQDLVWVACNIKQEPIMNRTRRQIDRKWWKHIPKLEPLPKHSIYDYWRLPNPTSIHASLVANLEFHLAAWPNFNEMSLLNFSLVLLPNLSWPCLQARHLLQGLALAWLPAHHQARYCHSLHCSWARDPCEHLPLEEKPIWSDIIIC